MILLRLLFFLALLSPFWTAVNVFAADKQKPKTEPAFSDNDYGFVRVFQALETDEEWLQAKTLKDKAKILYNRFLKFSVSSDPVSDRYLVTCYGGSIDLVHFWGLVLNSMQTDKAKEELLFQQWEEEGGWQNLKGFNHKSPPEAHPDDLPSNAFGALFAEQLKEHNDNPSFELRRAFEAFITPLIPVPDKIAKEFSHREIVDALPRKPSRKEEERAQAYFTAEPLLHCSEINFHAKKFDGKPLCEDFTDGRQALKKAGFQLRSYRNRPIVIERTAEDE